MVLVFSIVVVVHDLYVKVIYSPTNLLTGQCSTHFSGRQRTHVHGTRTKIRHVF